MLINAATTDAALIHYRDNGTISERKEAKAELVKRGLDYSADQTALNNAKSAARAAERLIKYEQQGWGERGGWGYGRGF